MDDRETLEPLVDKIVELSQGPEQEVRKQLWARFNALQPVSKPPVCVTYGGIPGRQWDLMFGRNHLRCADPLARHIEFDLKKRIWVEQNVPDDNVTWPAVLVPAVVGSPPDWGVPVGWRSPDDELGAKEITAPFADHIDLTRLQVPRTEVDDAATQSKLDHTSELVGGRLAVHPTYPGLGKAVFDDAVQLRGMERLLTDVIDSPGTVHAMMTFITDAVVADHNQRERRGWINAPPDPTGRYQMVPIFRHVAAFLPADFADRKPLLRDEWAYISAQMSAGLGPDMYAEFVHRYNCPLAELFVDNTVYYHGCECLDRKIDSIASLPNLRRFHVSPWSSVARAAETFQGSVLLEVHAHPTEVFFAATRDDMRSELVGLLEAADGHPLCLNLSDIHSVADNPDTLRTWAEVAQDMAHRYPCRYP